MNNIERNNKMKFLNNNKRNFLKKSVLLICNENESSILMSQINYRVNRNRIYLKLLRKDRINNSQRVYRVL